jgi:hypothetical protein
MQPSTSAKAQTGLSFDSGLDEEEPISDESLNLTEEEERLYNEIGELETLRFQETTS